MLYARQLESFGFPSLGGQKGYCASPKRLRRSILAALLVIIWFCLSSTVIESQTANLIVNGGFEDPVLPPGMFQVFSSIPGWTALPGRPDFELQRGVAGAAFEGNQHCELDAFAPSAIFQDVPTVPGRVYELSFAFSARPGTPRTDNVLRISWGGQEITTLTEDGTGLSNTVWTVHRFQVLSGPGTTTRLVFEDLGVANTLGTYIDYVSLSCIGPTCPTTTGLQFYPLPTPVRLLDTRPGASSNACTQPNAPIAGGTSLTQAARGICTIPASARAITGNVTTVNSGGGYLTLYPSDAAQPIVANSNYGPNEVINNVFTVGLGAGDGAFKIFALNVTDVVVDVTGYYAPPATGGLYFHPLPSPVRLLETRPGEPVGCIKPGAPLIADSDTLQTAIGACTGIPAAARAIVGNATTVSPQANGYLTLFPADATRPVIASSNYGAGQVVNGPFAVGLSAAGQFKIYTLAQTHLVVDVLGYYSTEAADANGAGLLFTPLAHPVRLLETRGQPPNLPGCFKPNAPLNGNQTYTQPARGLCDGLTIPASALGVVGNATVVAPLAGGYLTLWPSTATQPTVATSNYNTGQVVNRHFIVGLGGADGTFKMFSLATTNLVIDVSGYFAP